MSEGANKWVMPIGALVVGAVAGFIYPQSQNSKLSSEVASLTSSLGEQTSKAKGAAAEVAKLTEGLAGRTSALDEAKKQVAGLAEKITGLESSLGESKSMAQAAEAKSKQLGDDIAAKSSSLEAVRGELSAAGAKLADAEKALEAEKANSTDMSNSVKGLTATIEELKVTAKTADSKIGLMATEAKNNAAMVEEQNGTIATLRASIAELEKKLAEASQ